MQIEIEQYGDPNQIIFLPHQMLLENGSLTFRSEREATTTPIAASLFEVQGVEAVKIGTDFIQVTKSPDQATEKISKECKTRIADHLGGLVEAKKRDGGDYPWLLDAATLGALTFF